MSQVSDLQLTKYMFGPSSTGENMKAMQRIACILSELALADRTAVLQRLPLSDRIQLSAVHRTRVESEAAMPRRRPISHERDDPQSVILQFIDATSARTKPLTPDSAPISSHALIADTLKCESPQTIAVALSAMRAEIAASVLVEFSPSNQLSIIHRIADSRSVNPDVLDEVIESVRESVTEVLGPTRVVDKLFAEPTKIATGLSVLQNMIATATPGVHSTLWAAIERASADIASCLVLNRSA